MNFNQHSALQGSHALLSASSSAWVNYDADKLETWFALQLAKQEGTELHELAATLIQKGIKLPDNTKTLNSYVNDAIGYRMTPEQVLFYSINCFGTADAISFRDGLLRIHDLKTGITKAGMRQLEVYAALFCLEYDVKPGEIQMECRLYIQDEVKIHTPEVFDIAQIMSIIVSHDRRINEMRLEAQR
ncbi:Cas4 family exonuclease [Arthrobacter phage Giantsbane]|nr:Cas4 family exonuclease [Arthrobacter phage Giantsbane]